MRRTRFLKNLKSINGLIKTIKNSASAVLPLEFSQLQSPTQTANQYVRC